MRAIEIKKGIYWVGAIDWGVRDFHGYSTPMGSTYNAYLLVDDKVVLFDTVKKGFARDLLAHITQIIEPGKIDYIVVNHVEMDHTGSLPEIVEAVRPEKIICSTMGKKALVAHFHRQDWPYEVVSTGQSISVGSKTVEFIETRMIHWPDSMFSYIPEDRLLISQDGFGQHWATSERFDDEVDQSELMRQSAKYFANILLPYSMLVQKLLGQIKQSALAIDMIAPDHGLIWRSDPGRIVKAWDEWSRQVTKPKAVVAYDSMWHSTEMMARAIADGIESAGGSVKVMGLDGNHRSDVMTEVLDARAIVLGSATINNGMMPRMADLLAYMKGLRPSGKIAAAFGSYGWGGEAPRLIDAFIAEMKFESAGECLRVNYVPTADDLARCFDLGAKVGAMVEASPAVS
jgi:flavorubredoxin